MEVGGSISFSSSARLALVDGGSRGGESAAASTGSGAADSDLPAPALSDEPILKIQNVFTISPAELPETSEHSISRERRSDLPGTVSEMNSHSLDSGRQEEGTIGDTGPRLTWPYADATLGASSPSALQNHRPPQFIRERSLRSFSGADLSLVPPSAQSFELQPLVDPPGDMRAIRTKLFQSLLLDDLDPEGSRVSCSSENAFDNKGLLENQSTSSRMRPSDASARDKTGSRSSMFPSTSTFLAIGPQSCWSRALRFLLRVTKPWDDEERDCGFELATLLLCRTNFTGSMSLNEAQKYRAHLVRMSWLEKSGTVVFDLVFGIMDPSSVPRMVWDLLMLASLIYICIMVPIYIGFDTTANEFADWLGLLDLVVDVFFIVDIWMNTRTSYFLPSGKTVRKRGKIVRNYVMTWFFLDAVSSIPFDWVMGSQASSVRLVKASRLAKLGKVVRILRLVKIFKLSQMPGLMQYMENLIDRSVIRLTAFMLSGAMVAHFMACVLYWTATMQDPDSVYPGWTSVLEEEEGDWNVLHKYVASLYWSFSTITTVGYGDLVPTSTLERFVAIVSMVVGVTIFGYFMGNMTSMVGAMNDAQQEHDKRMEAISKFLRFRDIPSSLADRVTSYYQFLWNRELQQEEQMWLEGLNPVLRTEMVLYIYQDAINRVPFFNGKHPHFIAAMVQNLKPETYSPMEVVSREGEPATCMYFVSRGAVFVCLQVNDEIAQDILSGNKVPKFDNNEKEGQEERVDLAKLRRQETFSPVRRDNSHTIFGMKDSNPSMSVIEDDQEERIARRKVLETMQSAQKTRQGRAVPLSGGMRRRGAGGEDSDEDEEANLHKEKQWQASEHEEVIYMLADDVCEIRATRHGRARGTRKMSSHGTRHASKDEMGDELYEKFAMSRRVTRVHTDLEMIEAVAVLGSGTRAYRRVGTLKPGTYFGEYSCLLGLQRTITVVAADFVEVFALTRDALENVLSDWPDIADEFRSMVRHPNGDPAETHTSPGEVHSGNSGWNLVMSNKHKLKNIIGLSRSCHGEKSAEVSHEVATTIRRVSSNAELLIQRSDPSDYNVKSSIEQFTAPNGNRWSTPKRRSQTDGDDASGDSSSFRGPSTPAKQTNVSRVEALRDRRKSMHTSQLPRADSVSAMDSNAPSPQQQRRPESAGQSGSSRSLLPIVGAIGKMRRKTLKNGPSTYHGEAAASQ